MTLTLPPELSERLNEEAARQGIEPGDYAQMLLNEALTGKPKTGAEAIAYWEREGVFGLFSDRPEDSPELARKLRSEAEQSREDAA